MSTAFLANLPCQTRTDVTAAELEELLSALVRAAQQGWPEVNVAGEAFVAYLAERISGEQPVSQALGEIFAVDLYLACGCAAGNANALRAFEEQKMRRAREALQRSTYLRHVCDEATQLLRVRLFVGTEQEPPRILAYSGRGRLTNWVRAAATQLALGLLRKPVGQADLENRVLCGLRAPNDDLEISYIKSEYGAAFDDALRDAVASLSARDRNLLRHYFGNGLTVDQIGLLYRVHRSTAARWIASIREYLGEQVRKLVIERMQLGRDEASSILRLVRSQLDPSLCSLVGAPPTEPSNS